MQVKSISAILSTFIKLPFVIKIIVLPIFEWSLKTGFIVIPKVTLAMAQKGLWKHTNTHMDMT